MVEHKLTSTSCGLDTGAGTIADLIVQKRRGGVIAICALRPILGRVIGPFAGGYLAAGRDWRRIFWVLAIIGSFFTIASLISLRETYPPPCASQMAYNTPHQGDG